MLSDMAKVLFTTLSICRSQLRSQHWWRCVASGKYDDEWWRANF